MPRFSATTDSEATVAADRKAIWEVLTDPVMLPRLTPLLRRIEADGDLWRWELTKLEVLGIGIRPSFTERMQFDEPEWIQYHHEPPADRREFTSAEGWYHLTEVEGGTHLRIQLTLTVDLPLSGAARPAVQRVMKSVMARTGERFAHNLLDHLGIPG